MFDIGFWELAVIAVVALLVVGPNDLPKVVRTVSSGITKVRNFVHNVGVQLNEEAGKMEDFQRLVAKETKLEELNKVLDATTPNPAADAPAARPGSRTGQGNASAAPAAPAAERKVDPPTGQSDGGTR